jgi:hypothetical protein
MASIEYESSRLESSLRTLRQQWRDAQSVWDDPVSRGFERDYFAPLDQQTTAMLSELAKLGEVISQAKRAVP